MKRMNQGMRGEKKEGVRSRKRIKDGRRGKKGKREIRERGKVEGWTGVKKRWKRKKR